MPTRTVQLDVGAPGTNGVAALTEGATVSFTPSDRLKVGTTLVVPEPVVATAGSSVALEVTPAGWAYKVEIWTRKERHRPLWVTVPDGGAVALVDLPVVDPKTLQAVAPETAWAAGVSQAQAAASAASATRGLPSWAGSPAARPGPFDAVRCVYNWRSSNTARLRAGIARALAGGSGKFHAVAMADSLGLGYDGTSTIEAQAFPRRALTSLALLTGGQLGGTGVVPAGVATDRWSSTGTVERALYAGFLTMFAGSTATYVSERAGTAVDLYYSNLSAPFSYRVDGGPVQNVTPNGSQTIGKSTLTGLSDGVHTVVVTAPTNYVFLTAVELRRASGLVMHNLSFGGSTAANGGPATSWTDTSTHTSINTALKGSLDAAGISPDLLVIGLGANDKASGASDAVALAGIQTMRGWYPNADCLLVQAWRNPATTQAAWDAYVEGKYALADTLDAPLVDWQLRTGTLTQATARGAVAPDGTHGTGPTNIDWGTSLGSLLAT